MKALKILSNILLSERCPICGELSLYSRTKVLCETCTDLLLSNNISNAANCCNQCGIPLISGTERCLQCRNKEINYIANRSLFRYQGEIKELIYQYKFKGQKNYSLLFAKLIFEYTLRNNLTDVIVPVPGRKIVKRDQGWEHVDLISQILSKKYKIPVIKLLKRRGKKAQKVLNIEKRALNLQNSIKIVKKIKSMPHSVILLDDVFTTGTTINECAAILKHAGVKDVSSLTIAID